MAIPKQAKLVFRGIIFDVYQWKQKLFDGSLATFESLRRPNTVQIIPIESTGKILLAFEEQPTKPLTYTFFGGRQENGETPSQAAQRELSEETGYKSDNWQLLKSYHFTSKIEWSTYLFLAKSCQSVSQPKLEPGEKIQIKQVTFEQLIDLVCLEGFWTNQEIVADFLRMKLEPKKLEEFRKKLF